MSKMTFEEARQRMQSMEHLMYATKDINYWEFTEEPTPIGAPESMECIYQGRDRKTGITQQWSIDRVDIRQHGTLENVKKHIHRQFTKSLVVLGRAVDRARASRSRLLLPSHVNPKGAASIAFQRLQAGDLNH